MRNCFLILFFGIIFSILFYRVFISDEVFPWNRDKAIETALKWGGLEKLPEKIDLIKVEKKGSIFTRQFIVEFSSEDAEIKKWINKSKTLKNNNPILKNKRTIYNIIPGEEGALGGKVEIVKNKVLINISWS